MSAKAESIAQCGIDHAVLGLVKREVQFGIQFRVIGKMIDGWGTTSLVTAMIQARASRAPAAPRQWPVILFGGTDVQLVGVLAENVQDGLCFGYISQRCGSAVYVDIVDLPDACLHLSGLFPSHSWLRGLPDAGR